MEGIVIDSVYIENITNNEDAVEKKFSFYTDITMTKKLRFVNNVTNYVVNKENNNYYSQLRDLMFDFELLNSFTDIDLSALYESEDAVDDIEKFLDNTNAVEVVKANVDEGVIKKLEQAVDDNITFRTGVKKDFLSKFGDVLVENFEKAFSNINPEELAKLAKGLNDLSGELTADKVVEAFGKSKFGD